MKDKTNKQTFRCPFCQRPFKVKNSRNFFVAKCQCDEIPVLEGIIYLLKNDSLRHKKISQAIYEKKLLKAIWIALSDQATTHRMMMMGIYLMHKYTTIKPSLTLSLKLFMIVGPSRSWFRYLLKTDERNTLKTATGLMKSIHDKSTILDIGCGLGHLSHSIVKNNTSVNFFSIDKSFFSLLLAQIYHPSNQVKYICTDIEQGIPLSDKSMSNIIFLDTFAWIMNKKRVIEESFRCLSRKSSLLVINVHEQMNKTYWWGYGIAPHKLRLYFYSSGFNRVSFFSNDLSYNQTTRTVENKTNKEGYSCLAKKK